MSNPALKAGADVAAAFLRAHSAALAARVATWLDETDTPGPDALYDPAVKAVLPALIELLAAQVDALGEANAGA